MNTSIILLHEPEFINDVLFELKKDVIDYTVVVDMYLNHYTRHLLDNVIGAAVEDVINDMGVHAIYIGSVIDNNVQILVQSYVDRYKDNIYSILYNNGLVFRQGMMLSIRVMTTEKDIILALTRTGG